MKHIVYVVALVMISAYAIGAIHRDYVMAQQNDAYDRVVFDQSRLGFQEIPSDDVYVVYFRDSGAGLCYALIKGQVLLKPGWSYGFGNIVVVPCDKALWSSITQ